MVADRNAGDQSASAATFGNATLSPLQPIAAAHSENRSEQPTCHRQNTPISHRVSLPAKFSNTTVMPFGLLLTNWPHRSSAFRRPVCQRRFVGNDFQVNRSVNVPANRRAVPTMCSARLVQPAACVNVFLFECFLFRNFAPST
jgi:hypothetical protein